MKKADAEVEIEGPQKEVSDVLTHIDKYADNFLKTFTNSKLVDKLSSVTAISSAETSEAESTQVFDPPILGKTRSTSEALRRLLQSPWGRRPHTLREFVEALKVNGMSIPSTSLSGYLTDFAQRGDVRRRGTRRGYEYTPTPHLLEASRAVEGTRSGNVTG